jgi:hypothetical protein
MAKRLAGRSKGQKGAIVLRLTPLPHAINARVACETTHLGGGYEFSLACKILAIRAYQKAT